jgi:hypothetical protein
MPAKAPAQFAVEVQPVVTTDIDTIQIVYIGIHLPYTEGNVPVLEVQYVGGLDDGLGNIDWTIDERIRVEGVEFGTLISQTASGTSVYDVVKNAVYDKLIADGILPADATII